MFPWRSWTCLVVLVMAGCAPESTDLRPGGQVSDAVGPGGVTFVERTWPFRPAGMRVHPLTRLTEDRDTGLTVLETRIEFFDRWDDTTKAMGILQVDLFRLDSDAGRLVPMHEWRMDLADLELNERHFDDVTRTYLFRLRLEPEEVPDTIQVVCSFRADDGDELVAHLDIELR